MKVKGIVDEDFVNYKKASMFITFPNCSFKCDKECGRAVCQNSTLAREKDIEIPIQSLIERYGQNPITKAVVCGGLEPFDSWVELQCFIINFRQWFPDDIVIYTGYKEEEIKDKIEWLKLYEPIVVKYGRFIPDDVSHLDHTLGVKLSSSNQYAVRYE